VRQLFLSHQKGAGLGDIDCGDFDATNFAQLVAAVGPHLTGIGIGEGYEALLGPPFWAALRDSVVPARKLRVLDVFDIPKGVSKSVIESMVQLRGSLEHLALWGLDSERDYGNRAVGLRRFPESFLALTKLQTLKLRFPLQDRNDPGRHQRAEARSRVWRRSMFPRTWL